MSAERIVDRTFRGKVIVASDAVDTVFPLFSPLGEKSWVPGWDPELLYPKGVEWARGQIFRTREEQGEAVWIVTGLDHEKHSVEYHRVEPGRWVARVSVDCHASSGSTEAEVTYTFLGLSEAGNREIAAMTDDEYESKLARWSEWITERFARERSEG